MLTVHQSNLVVRRVFCMDEVRHAMERLQHRGLSQAYNKWKLIVRLEKARLRNIGIILNSLYQKRIRQVFASIKRRNVKS